MEPKIEPQEEEEEEIKVVEVGHGNFKSRVKGLIDTLSNAEAGDIHAIVCCIASKDATIDFHLIASKEMDMNQFLLVTSIEILKMVLEQRTKSSLEDILRDLMESGNVALIKTPDDSVS
jgi:hypothetical protein